MEDVFRGMTDETVRAYAAQMYEVIKEYRPCKDCDTPVCKKMWEILKGIENARTAQ